MTTLPTSDSERRELADRYVLGDPSLDASQFEAWMLEDAALALMVARSVEELSTISQASRLATVTPAAPLPAVTRSGPSRRFTAWVAGCVAAAACLAIGLYAFRESGSSPENQAWTLSLPAEPEDMQQVAEHWLALATAEEDIHEAETGPAEFHADVISEVDTRSDPVAAHSIEEEDWLVEAAQLYFEEFDS